MKTTFKAAIAMVLAIAAAFGVRALYSAAAVSGEDGVMDVYQNLMLDARAMFVEKADDIQLCTLALLKESDLSIMSDSEGRPWVIGENGEKQKPEEVIAGEVQPYLDAIFGEYECGGHIYNISVTDKAVVFFTGYHEAGSVGFLYERELGGVTEFTELLELSENWQVFYSLRDE